MAEMKIMAPWMPELFDRMTEDSAILFDGKAEDERLNSILFKNVNVAEEDFSHMSFSQVRFENCSFFNCSFEKAELSDVIFHSCNISGCNFTDSYLNRCRLEASKGVGTRITGSIIKHVAIRDCSMGYANLDSSKLENFIVIDTEFSNGNITQCKCKNVFWDRVNLSNTSFFKTLLRGMDFTTCTITGLVLSDECSELKGAVVDLYQAAELAKRLGLIIK